MHVLSVKDRSQIAANGALELNKNASHSATMAKPAQPKFIPPAGKYIEPMRLNFTGTQDHHC